MTYVLQRHLSFEEFYSELIFMYATIPCGLYLILDIVLTKSLKKKSIVIIKFFPTRFLQL